MASPPTESTISRSRLLLGYGVLAAAVAAVLGAAFVFGSGLPASEAATSNAKKPVLGAYNVEGGRGCLGSPPAPDGLMVQRSGSNYRILIGDSSTDASVVAGRLEATVQCPTGHPGALSVELLSHPSGTTLVGTLDEDSFVAESRELSGEETFGRLMLAIAVAILVARALGGLLSRIGQPRVMGEVIGGILLGPSLFGLLVPNIQSFVFPPSITPLLGGAADIGLAFYMFLVGLELDPALLRGRLAQAAFISNASVLVPMAAGAVLALALYSEFGMLGFAPFALFMGVAMSITAFPVLARILTERRMLRRPVGAMALAAAAVDDVSAWTLLALASAVALSGQDSPLGVAVVLGLTAALSGFMFFVARPFLRRIAVAYGEVGSLPPAWLAVVFVGVLLAAYAASAIGVAAIFGAFLMGMVMPRRADLTRDLTERVEPFVVTVLLPLFFVVTGLRTEIGLLGSPTAWLTALAIIGVAVASKWGSAMLAARFVGWDWKPAAAVGALMNTRGLTELIVLNIGRELGVIGPELFAMLVVMALVTTLMTGPTMHLIDPTRSLSEQPGEELRAAIEEAAFPERPARTSRTVLVAAQDAKNFDALLSIAVPAAALGHQREILLALLLPPAALSTGVRVDAERLSDGTREVQNRRRALLEQQVPSRAVAYVSPDFGADLVRLSETHDVDLVVIDGQRPILGDPIPRGPMLNVLSNAECDVAVVISRQDTGELGDSGPVVVPFGGADHDWAALELATVVARVAGVGVKLVGASRGDSDSRSISRLLASASLAVQQLSGVVVETQLTEPGAAGVLSAATGASALMVGLSTRWREEGIGEVRQYIAQHASILTVLVRSGGARSFLRTEGSATRVAWSRAPEGGGAAQ